MPKSDYCFNCGDAHLETVSKYVCLGVASRAFGSLICKVKQCGGFPYVTYSKLYDTLVWPILDYSSAIWGTFSAINKLQNQACRSFLGLGKFTTNVAVQSEMGWITPIHRQ